VDNSSTSGAGGIDFISYSSYDDCTVTDTILWNNTGPVGPEIQFDGGVLAIEYSDLEGGQASVFVDPSATLVWGSGMIDADPLFLAPTADDYRLQQDPPESGVVNPCVDAGSAAAAAFSSATTRSDWEPDIVVIDIGYHYYKPYGTAFVRNPGPNPESYTAPSWPDLGSPFSLQVDLGGTTNHSFAMLVAYTEPLTLVLGGGQVLLVDPTSFGGELTGMPWLPGPQAQFSFLLPLDYTLAGFELSSQAIHFGGVQPFALSNALDIQLGF